MKVEAVVGAARGAVGYLVYKAPGGRALIIDAPLRSTGLYLKAIKNAGVTVEYVVSTHGHWDQIADNDSLCKATGASLCAHTWDAARLSDPRLGTEDPHERVPNIKGRSVNRVLRDGEELEVGGLTFEVMHTPGHTPGSVCLFEPQLGALFCGDVLARNAIGRTDFPGGNASQLQESLRRIAILPDTTHIFPGHGPATMLGEERWLLDLAKMSSA